MFDLVPGSAGNPTPGKSSRNTIRRAFGGPIIGAGGPRDDRVPFLGSNGEHVLDAFEVEAMGGHAGVYAFRSAARAGAFSSKPDSYTAQASSFGVPAAAAAPSIDMSKLLASLPPAVAAATESGIVTGLQRFGVQPGDNLRRAIQG